MSIKLMAQDLYRCQKEVARLENELAVSPQENRARIEAELRKAKKERDYLRRALDGQLGR